MVRTRLTTFLLERASHENALSARGTIGAWRTELGPIPSQVVNCGEGSVNTHGLDHEVAVEDEDLEEFLPIA